MPTLQQLAIAILVAAAAPAFAQDERDKPTVDDDRPAAAGAPDAEDSQEGIVLEEPATSVKEVMERRAKLETEAAAELATAKAAYDQRVAAADQQAANNLELIARRAVSDGQLADAAKAWEEVLRIDGDNAAAKAFFRTINRWDVVQKRLAHDRSKANDTAALTGNWRGRWGTTGSVFHLELGNDGGPVKQVGGRHLLIDPGRSQQLELIPTGDRIVVLGWSTGEGRDPRVPPSSLKGLPDHVGFAWRVE